MSIIVDEQTKLDPFVRGGALLRPLHALDQVSSARPGGRPPRRRALFTIVAGYYLAIALGY